MTSLLERRVRRSKQSESLLMALSESVFPTMADALVFAAAIAVRTGERCEFEAASEPIRYSVFDSRSLSSAIDLIALSVSGDIRILSDDQLAKRLAIFEEAAEAGLQQIAREHDAHASLLDACLSFVRQRRTEPEIDLLKEIEDL